MSEEATEAAEIDDKAEQAGEESDSEASKSTNIPAAILAEKPCEIAKKFSCKLCENNFNSEKGLTVHKGRKHRDCVRSPIPQLDGNSDYIEEDRVIIRELLEKTSLWEEHHFGKKHHFDHHIGKIISLSNFCGKTHHIHRG